MLSAIKINIRDNLNRKKGGEINSISTAFLGPSTSDASLAPVNLDFVAYEQGVATEFVHDIKLDHTT